MTKKKFGVNFLIQAIFLCKSLFDLICYDRKKKSFVFITVTHHLLYVGFLVKIVNLHQF